MRKRIMAVLSRQETRYILVGLTQLALDWMLFVAMTASGVSTVLANTLGRILIAILGFHLHGRYTFVESSGNVRLGWKRFARFVTTWVSLTAISTLAMYLVRSNWGLHAAWGAKPVVEACIALVSYLLLKRWVYR